MKEMVIVLAKINVDGKGFVLLGVRLKGTSIFCSPLAFDPSFIRFPLSSCSFLTLSVSFLFFCLDYSKGMRLNACLRTLPQLKS